MEPQTPVSLSRSGRRKLALCGLIAVTAVGGGASPAAGGDRRYTVRRTIGIPK